MKRFTHVLAVAFVCGSSLGIVNAQVTFTVTSTADGPGAATSVGTLRYAVTEAEKTVAEDRIEFASTLTDAVITLDDDEGQLEITEDLVIDGSGAPGLKISGGWNGVRATYTEPDPPGTSPLNDPANYSGNVGTRIFILPTGSAPTVSISSLELTLGNAGPSRGGSDPGVPNDNGGAIFLEDGDLTLTDVTVSSCTANDGAGLVLQETTGGDGSVTLNGCTFVDNRARDDGGVADMKAGTSLTAINCTFYGNVAGSGGAIADQTGSTGSLARTKGTLALDHCTVGYSQANANVVDGRDGKVDLSRNLFVGNVDDDGTLSTIRVSNANDVRDFAGNAPLTIADGNFGDLTQAGFNPTTAEEAALGPLADNGGPTATAALGCLTTVRGAVASGGYGVDQRNQPRSGASEPGAYELAGCPDTDGDAVLDFADAEVDDDDDGINDVDEISQAALVTSDASTTGASTSLGTSGSLEAGGAQLDYVFDADGSVADATTNASADGYVISYDNERADQRPTLSFDFGEPVYGLSFTLGGFDIAGATGTEEVTATLIYEAPDGTVITQVLRASDLTLTGDVEQDGNRLRATGATTGQAALNDYPLPVSRIELTYSVGPITGDPAPLELTLSEITFRDPSDLNPDGDPYPAPIDIDADGDGIVDHSEAQTEAAYVQGADNLTPIDTDNDGTPDFLDEDSDDDGEPDVIEGHDMDNDGVVDASSPARDGAPLGTDVDEDGLDDGYDNILPPSTNDNATNFAGPGTYANTDNIGVSGDEGNWRDNDANIAGRIFADENGDGIQQSGEGGVDGATVKVYDVDDTDPNPDPIAQATVGADGRFLFTDVTDQGAFEENVTITNFYLVFAGIPTRSTPVDQDQGGDDRLDSDYNPADLRTANFTVSESTPAAFFGAGFAETTLPVTFVSITATATADCGASVTWTVADERDVDHYRVERLDRDGTWVLDVEVAATGTDAYTADASAAGAYYRVANVDLDGSTAYTETVIAPDCASGVARASAQPNPVSAGATLTLVWGSTPTRPVTVHDAAGRIVRELAVGTTRLDIDLPTGMYMARSGGEAIRFVVR